MGEPLVVEILGVAGSGKSSVVNDLIEHKKVDQLSLAFLKNSLLFKLVAAKLFFSYPYFFSKLLLLNQFGRRNKVIASRSPFWQLTSAMVKLDLFNSNFKDISNKGRFLILDEGPLFWCVVLLVYSPDSMNQVIKKMVNKKIETNLIKKVNPVYLTCRPQTSIDRVLNRNRNHAFKDISDVERKQFIVKYNEAFEWLLEKKKLDNEYKITTEGKSIREVSNETYSEIERLSNL
jgi:deoxyadenosine/deoxycytidine kinase